MHGWIARYEEGYVGSSGEIVSLHVEIREDQTWETEDEAMRQWLSLESVSKNRVERQGNGFIQVDDVSARTNFRALGVEQIWRKISFVERS